MGLNKKIIWSVLSVQVIITSVESLRAIQCHIAGSYQCWPWFFAFLVNLPASLVVNPITESIIAQVSYYPSVGILFIAYTVVGTVWWSFLVYISVMAFGGIINILRRQRGRRHT